MKVLVLARSEARYGEDWAEELTRTLGVDCQGRSFPIDGGSHKIQRPSFLAAFETISDVIEHLLLEDAVFRRTRLVLVTSEGDSGPKPLPQSLLATDFTYWSNLTSLLVLAFPDIHWVFATTSGEDEAMTVAGLKAHSLPPADERRLELLADQQEGGNSPLFDATGLRNFIKTASFRALDVLNKQNGVAISPERNGLALVIEDEVEVGGAVAYLHYRRGYRVQVVNTEAEFQRAASLQQVARSTESATLEFPDSSGNSESLKPNNRSVRLPVLAGLGPAKRIIFTIDDNTATSPAKDDEYSVIHSPFDGLLGLARQLGLDNAPDGFAWPPEHRERGYTAGRHAMPGYLTVAARRLLTRARLETRAVYESCLFALEAQELLLNRSPSLSLQAHKSRLTHEIRLENDVPTVLGGAATGHERRLQSRFREIGHELDSMLTVVASRDSARREKLKRSLGAQLAGTMIDGYRRGYHFQEELAAIAKRREFDFGGTLPGRYLAWVLAGPPWHFLAAVAGWIVGFACLYLAIGLHLDAGLSSLPTASWKALVVSAYTLASVGLAPPEFLWTDPLGASWAYRIAATLECVAGLAHWGLGMAHLYTLVSRR